MKNPLSLTDFKGLGSCHGRQWKTPHHRTEALTSAFSVSTLILICRLFFNSALNLAADVRMVREIIFRVAEMCRFASGFIQLCKIYLQVVDVVTVFFSTVREKGDEICKFLLTILHYSTGYNKRVYSKYLQR